MRTMKVAVLVMTLALLSPACGGDDGADVREVGESGGSGSGSASGSASASGSGSASASGVAAECRPVGDPETADSTVDVTLEEWAIGAPEALDAGAVHVAAENRGEEPHELLIMRAESTDDIPTNDAGSVDEGAIPEADFIGEIEPFPGGETCDGVFDLEAGDYAFICAIVEEEENGEIEDHFQEGMLTFVSVD